MKAYPIFLLPKGEIMMTAKIDGDEIKLLKKTLFPSNNRYCISEKGLSACLDKEKRLIIYGYIKDDGEMEDVSILPFPSMISPKSICILKSTFILGGENNHYFSNDIKSHELVATYSISQNKFTAVEMPFKEYDKCIDDLLLDNDKIIAVDNIVYPKYLLEYDFSNPDFPNLIVSHSLPANGTYETIKKGTLNESYIALISSSIGMDGGGRHINIFRKGNYERYIRLSHYFGMSNENDDDDKINHYWRDILLLPNQNILFVPSNEDGIGIYLINDYMMSETDDEDSKSIMYINNWDKKAIKVLLPPENNEKVLIIFEEGDDDNLCYSFSLESIDDLLNQYYESCNNFDEDEDSWGGYDNGGDSEYCGACQESPCMCSDREKSSMTYDY